jgi:hypothetical protein
MDSLPPTFLIFQLGVGLSGGPMGGDDSERRGRKIASAAGLTAVGHLGVLAEVKGLWIGEILYRRYLDEVGE